MNLHWICYWEGMLCWEKQVIRGLSLKGASCPWPLLVSFPLPRVAEVDSLSSTLVRCDVLPPRPRKGEISLHGLKSLLCSCLLVLGVSPGLHTCYSSQVFYHGADPCPPSGGMSCFATASKDWQTQAMSVCHLLNAFRVSSRLFLSPWSFQINCLSVSYGSYNLTS